MNVSIPSELLQSFQATRSLIHRNVFSFFLLSYSFQQFSIMLSTLSIWVVSINCSISQLLIVSSLLQPILHHVHSKTEFNRHFARVVIKHPVIGMSHSLYLLAVSIVNYSTVHPVQFHPLHPIPTLPPFQTVISIGSNLV